MNKKNQKSTKIAGIVLILVLGAGIYSNTFQSTFQFDDIAFILRNYAIRNLWDWGAISRAVLDQPSRVVGLYSFAINYYFHQLDVFGYHLTNWAIHMVNTFLVWWLSSLILTLVFQRQDKECSDYLAANRQKAKGSLKSKAALTQRQKKGKCALTQGLPVPSRELRALIPFCAALIFCVHPVQTQAVTYISQRFASLATLFYLASLGCYVKARFSWKDGVVQKVEICSREKDVGPERRKEKDRRKEGRRQGVDRRKKHREIEGEDQQRYFERRKLNDRRTHTARRASEQKKRLAFEERLQEKESAKQARQVKKKLKRNAQKAKSQKVTSQTMVSPVSCKGSKRPSVHGVFWASFYFVLSLAFAVLGMFTKEIVITLPLMILSVEILFFFDTQRDKKYLAVLGSVLAGLVLVIPALFSFKVASALFTPQPSESHPGDLLTFPTYLLTQLRVFTTFLRLLFVPLWQNFDYDFPMSHSLFEGTTFVSFCVLAALIVVALRARKKNPILCFAIVWFFVTLSANLIPRRHVIFEHKLYLVSVGFCLGVAYLLAQAFRTRKNYLLAVGMIISVLCVLTYQRNRVWETGITLWEDVVQKSPNKIRAHHNLGTYYRNAGRFDDALKCYDKALSLEPNYTIAINQKAGVLREQGKYPEALKAYDQALSLDSEMSKLYNNKGNVYKSLQRYEEAVENYNQAIKINPSYATAYYNRGLIWDKTRRYDLALSDYNHVIQLDPEFANAYNNRARLLCLQKRFDEALTDFQKAIQFDPDSTQAYFNLARTYEVLAQYDLAITNYRKALLLKSDYPEAYYNLGNIYAQVGRYDLAAEFYRKALRLNSAYSSAQTNLKKVEEIISQKDKFTK